MFCTTGPQFLSRLLSDSCRMPQKGGGTPFLFIEMHTRSWKAARWLDVLWHAPFHRAPSSHLSCLSLWNMSSLGLPPHTPYLGTPILFPQNIDRSLFLFSSLIKLPIWATQRLFLRNCTREHDMIGYNYSNELSSKQEKSIYALCNKQHLDHNQTQIVEQQAIVARRLSLFLPCSSSHFLAS